MGYCGEHIIVKSLGNVRRAATLKCRSWRCPDCGPMRQKRLIAEICAGTPNKFLTLTMRRTPGLTPAQAAQKLAWAWRDLRRLLIYWHKWEKLPFFAVFEPHKSGWPHLHIFLRSSWISQKELSCWMSWLLDSPIVHIKEIHNRGMAAGYAAKYVTKENVRFGTCKRYWQSYDYDTREDYIDDRITLPGTRVEILRVRLDVWLQGYSPTIWNIRTPRHGVAEVSLLRPP